MTFGKYKGTGTTWREVAEKDPKWITWVIGNVEWAQLDPEIYQAVGEPCDVPMVPPTPKNKSEVTQMNLDVLQTMIDGCAVLSTGIVEHDSLGHMIVVPMTDPSVIGRIHGFLLEVKKTLVSGSIYAVKPLPAEQGAASRPVASPRSALPIPDSSVPPWTDPTDDLPF